MHMCLLVCVFVCPYQHVYVYVVMRVFHIVVRTTTGREQNPDLADPARGEP